MTKDQDIQFALSEDFWKDSINLSLVQRGKVSRLLEKMQKDPWNASFHPERVKSARDDRIWSARVDDNYRLIWAHIQVRGKPDMVICLYVDKHDPAYERARKLQFQINDGMVRVVNLSEAPEQPKHREPSFVSDTKQRYGKLFMGYRDQALLDSGVPEDLLPYVRRLDNEDELDKLAKRLPEDVYNNLIALALGDMELVRVPNAQLHRSLERYHGGDNLHLFVNSEEFKRALEGDWEDWMLFLAPHQRRLVYADYAGPARVKGVAGSGKTVVAIHRALHLARTLPGDGKILFLTYGNRLPGVIQYLLEKLAGPGAPELRRIECITVHRWCLKQIRSTGDSFNVGDRYKLSDAIDAGIEQTKRMYPGLKMWAHERTFFQDEIRYAIKGRAIKNFAEYAALERSGRGTALSETERKAMWQVYLGYQRYLDERGVSDFEDYMLKVLELIESGRLKVQYRAAVVDEIQDLNAATMKLIRTIVPSAPNDLFLVGDGLQKLYPGGYILGRLGIDIVGRGTVLRRNYRNTQEILRAAYAMMQHTRFHDLDEQDTEVKEPEYSPRSGALPMVKGFSSPEAELAWVAEEIARLKKSEGFRNKDFAILYRWRYPYKDILEQQFPYNIVALNDAPDTYFGPQMKMTTFDSAKGLEFKVVFLVGVTDSWMVPKDDFSLEGVALDEYLARERSRLFVAMTRARDLLYITYARGGLSRFLANVPKSCLDF